MASAHYFFIAATEHGELFAGITADLNKTMRQLAERPRRTANGPRLFERLVHYDFVATSRLAKLLLKSYSKKSPRERQAFVDEVNPDRQDLSSLWFPVAASPSFSYLRIPDFYGDSPGGIGARLDFNLPPRTGVERVDPFDRMTREELTACGAYKVLTVGPQ